MKRVIIFFFILSCVHVMAENLNREDAIKYFEIRSQHYKSAVLTGRYVKKNIYTVINLCWEETTKDDLKYLQLFPELETIHLSSAIQIKDKDLEFISNLPKLRILNLDNTMITGEGFKYLNNLPSLKEINLSATRVTDANLQELKKFKTLKNIWLYKSKVTQKGVDMLQKELPGCFISLKPQD
jgi:hypothetical protein